MRDQHELERRRAWLKQYAREVIETADLIEGLGNCPAWQERLVSEVLAELRRRDKPLERRCRELRGCHEAALEAWTAAHDDFRWFQKNWPRKAAVYDADYQEEDD